jgi:hypothetical protein
MVNRAHAGLAASSPTRSGRGGGSIRRGRDARRGLDAALADAEAFRAGLQERQARQFERLTARLPLPQLRLPYLFTAELGPAGLGVLAAELAAGVTALDEDLVP